mmetsp:Transcript_38396/g.62890  ORF Transcript_38396/g.62890 Transcript_38396/m.62890 type:complete len:329 (-) Transcript_38396:588-1574(-)
MHQLVSPRRVQAHAKEPWVRVRSRAVLVRHQRVPAPHEEEGRHLDVVLQEYPVLVEGPRVPALRDGRDQAPLLHAVPHDFLPVRPVQAVRDLQCFLVCRGLHVDNHVHPVSQVVRAQEGAQQPLQLGRPRGRDDAHAEGGLPPVAVCLRRQVRQPGHVPQLAGRHQHVRDLVFGGGQPHQLGHQPRAGGGHQGGGRHLQHYLLQLFQKEALEAPGAAVEGRRVWAQAQHIERLAYGHCQVLGEGQYRYVEAQWACQVFAKERRRLAQAVVRIHNQQDGGPVDGLGTVAIFLNTIGRTTSWLLTLKVEERGPMGRAPGIVIYQRLLHLG